MNKGIVIIGTGLAGYNLARQLRALDKIQSLTMITEDDGSYYSKPQLSAALRNNKSPSQLALQTAEQMTQQLQATIHTQTKVLSIDPDKKQIVTDCHGTIGYDRLVLALGAEKLPLPISGNGCDKILSVNNLQDYRLFRQQLNSHSKIIIIGAGLIGCEFANDLQQVGKTVHIIAPEQTPLARLIPEPCGQGLTDAFAAAGIHWHLQRNIKEVNVDNNNQFQVLLDDGEIITGDMVFAAIGIRPQVALAEAAHIHVQQGIKVNRYLETSAKDVYALGDCAQVEGLVLPYTLPLFNGAKALAKTLSGERTAVHYPAMPIIVKTSLYPIVLSTLAHNLPGSWTIAQYDEGIVAQLFNDNQLKGFVLTNQKTKERNNFLQQLSGILPS